MKKIICLFLPFFLVLCTALTSCKKGGPRSPFPLALPYGRAVTLSAGGEEHEFALVFTGDCLILRDKEDFVFRTEKGGSFLVSKDLVLPLASAYAPDKGMLFEALSASPDREFLKSERKDENGEKTVVYTLVGDVENFIYETDAEGKILRIDGEGAFSFSARFDD